MYGLLATGITSDELVGCSISAERTALEEIRGGDSYFNAIDTSRPETGGGADVKYG